MPLALELIHSEIQYTFVGGRKGGKKENRKRGKKKGEKREEERLLVLYVVIEINRVDRTSLI